MLASFNNIIYTKVGKGPHLCFLHGFCEDSRIWEPLVTQLAKSHTCVLIDLPGFGKSKNTPFTTIPQVATQIKNLLEYEKIQQPILLGHSLGGYILAEYMHRFPSSLSAAAYIHSSTKADTPLKMENRLKSIDFVEKNGTAEFFRLFVSGLVALPHRARLRDTLTAMVNTTSQASVIAGLQAMRSRVGRENSLHAFQKPILFLCGDEDQHYIPSDTYEQVASCTIAQISSLSNVGHLSMLEDPKNCLKELSHFLNFTTTLAKNGIPTNR